MRIIISFEESGINEGKVSENLNNAKMYLVTRGEIDDD